MCCAVLSLPLRSSPSLPHFTCGGSSPSSSSSSSSSSSAAAEALQQPQRRAYFLTNEGNFSPTLSLFLPRLSPLFTTSLSPSLPHSHSLVIFGFSFVNNEGTSERGVGGENAQCTGGEWVEDGLEGEYPSRDFKCCDRAAVVLSGTE